MTAHSPVPFRLLLRSGALLAAAALLLSSCSLRYYSATVFGYVRESTAAEDGTQAGLNGAEVLIYLEDPDATADAAASVRTSTMSSGGQDGYWSRKVMWSTRQPAFRDEGDTGTLWVRVTRRGYFPRTVRVYGILSDASNAVPTIELDKVLTSELRGRVVNDNGAGVNGVQVVLDLESTEDEEADYTASTATDEDGLVGVFVFADVAWEDADSLPRSIADGVATENVRVYIDDPSWYSDTNDSREPDLQAPIAIASDADTDLTALPIVVRSATFAAPIVRGRVVDEASPATGVNGVTVAVDFPLTAADPDATVVTATIGGQAGWYQFENLSWTNNRPNHSATGEKDDVVAARVYLDDGAWYSTRDADAPMELSIVSGQTTTIDDDIAAGDATFAVGSVSGRVVLAGTSTGENGVALRLELASSGTVLGATTTRAGSDDGIFEFRNVEWVDTKPERTSSGALAETEQVRVYVQDADYDSDTDAQSPLILTLSAGEDLPLGASPLSVSRVSFSVPKVSGSVVADATSAGVAGITVVLDLESTTDNARDYTATTDKNGDFVFSNIGWTDSTPDDATTDSETIELTIDHASYRTAVALPLKTIASGAAAGAIGMDPAWTIRAERTERWTYSVTLAGSCIYWNLSASPALESAVGGVTVTVTVTDAQGGDLQAASPLVVRTNADGDYTATIDWSREPDYAPSAEAAANGGDTLEVTVAFAHPTRDFGGPFVTDLLSWSANNILDGVDTDP